MPANPFTDLVEFLVGDTGDYNRFGVAKYVSVLFYLLLLAAGAYVAYRSWSRDPSQRTSKNLWVLAIRVTAGGMWFQGTIWKLPLPISPAFQFWLGSEAKFSAIPFQAAIVRDVLVPHIGLLQPATYLLEILFTVAFTLGIAVRLFGVIAVLFTLQLWLGLYNDPTEWPWTYMAIVFAHGMFVTAQAGQSLGLDHLLRLGAAPVAQRPTRLAQAYRLAS